MARRVYTIEERWALLLHYLNKYGLNQEHDDGRSCLVRKDGEMPSHGRARVRVYPENVTFTYFLPLPQPLSYRAELLEQLNDLNERHHWEMTFYIVCGARGWQLNMDGLVSYRGCSRTAAKRAASLIFWLLGMAERSLYELKEALPEYITDETLLKADEEYFRELTEEDFVTPEDPEWDEDEPEPEFDFSYDESAEEAHMPDWPEEWGDEEALIARYEAEGPDKFSGSELVKLDLAYKRVLARKKQQLNETLNEMNGGNPQQF